MEYAIEQFRKQLSEALGSVPNDLAEMRQRKNRLEAQVRRLVSAVAESGHSPAILEELGRKETELKAITDQLLSATPDSIESEVEELRKFVGSRLEDVLDVLRKDTSLARTEILKHTKEITMTPRRKTAFASRKGIGICWEPPQAWIADASIRTGVHGWLRGPATIRIV